MSDQYSDLLRMCRLMFEASQADLQDDELVALRAAAVDDIQAREALESNLDSSDVRIRILSAEALSRVGYAPGRAVPVLTAVLDVAASRSLSVQEAQWVVIALGGLANYGEDASLAAPTYWPFLYKRNDLNIQLYATRLAARLASVGDAHWTIWCLLCRHEETAVRRCAREEFKSWRDPEESRGSN